MLSAIKSQQSDVEVEISCENLYPKLYENLKKPDAWIWNQHIDILKSNRNDQINSEQLIEHAVNLVDNSEHNLYKTLQNEIYNLTNVKIDIPPED